jgi:RNA polymerase sigma-70 factor (ECF subfamily)
MVARCRAGDPAAFKRLFDLHKEDVGRLLRRLGVPASELEDLIQDVFVQVHRSISDFRGDARLSTWLYRLTVNVALMYRRSGRSRPVLVDEAAAAPPRDPQAPPDEQVDRKKRILAFYALLERISDKKRAVFVLHDLEGLSPLEIAKIVAAPVLTVRTRLFYARRELAEMIPNDPTLRDLVADESVGRLLPGRLGKETT